MSDRERLPNRRVSELVDFEHGGRRWTLTVGRFADGRVGEVFLDTPKASAIGEIAADAAIAPSVAFPTRLLAGNGAPCACGPPCGPPGCGAGVDRRLSGPT